MADFLFGDNNYPTAMYMGYSGITQLSFGDITIWPRMVTPTPTRTLTPSITPTNTVSITATPSITPTITPTRTVSITTTPSITPTITPSITVSITRTPSITPTITVSITRTPSITPTITVSITRTPSITPTITVSNTQTPSRTPSITPTLTVSITRTPSITPTLTVSITRTPSITPTLTVSMTPSITPTPSRGTLYNGLAGYWKLDESSGNALDSVSTNDGTLINTPTQGAAGKIVSGYTFASASSESISMGEVAALKLTQISISAWFKTSTSSYLCVASEINGTLSAGWSITTEATKLRCRVADNATHFAQADSTTSINTGAWFHIVLTSDGTNMKMYLNNTQEGGSQAFAYNIGYSTGTNAYFRIGARGDTPAQYFNGSIDEVGIWNRALTTTEISTLYGSGSGKAYPF